MDVEVWSVLRGLVLGHKLRSTAADAARLDYFDLVIARYDAAPLAERIWQLRHQHTSYDAFYLALSEASHAPLHTCDGKLDSRGHRVTIQVHATSG